MSYQTVHVQVLTCIFSDLVVGNGVFNLACVATDHCRLNIGKNKHLVLLEKLPWYFSPVTGPLVVWQKVLGELGVDGLSLRRPLEVGLLLEEDVDVVLQQPQVRLERVFVLPENQPLGSIF